MKIEWNKMTWDSKLLAVVVFVGVLGLGFYFGAQYQQIKIQNLRTLENYGQIKNITHASTPSVYPSDKVYGEVEKVIKSGATVTAFGRAPITSLPSDVYISQEGWIMNLGTIQFLIILQLNRNYAVEYPGHGEAKWAGLLIDDHGQWFKFFTVHNTPDSTNAGAVIHPNVVGVFAESGKLYVDVADDRGAGSGEGSLIRYFTVDGGKIWQQEAQSYYFIPEIYYIKVKGEEDLVERITPHRIKHTAEESFKEFEQGTTKIQ